MVDFVAGEEKGVREEWMELLVVGVGVEERPAVGGEWDRILGDEGVEVDLLADFWGEVEEGKRHCSL